MAHFHRCAERRQRRLTARIRLFQAQMGGRSLAGERSGFRLRAPASLTPARRLKFDSPRCYQVMSTQTIELEGFEIEIASELYCERGGDHRDLVDRARMDRRR